MVQPLRSNGTAPRTEQIELFGATHRTVLNLLPYWTLRSNCTVNCTEPYRTLKSTDRTVLNYFELFWILRSNDCTEHSDRVAVPYWTLRIQILSTPIELYRTSDRSLTVHCTARPNCTEHFDQNYSNSSEHFDRTTHLYTSNSSEHFRSVQNTKIIFLCWFPII